MMAAPPSRSHFEGELSLNQHNNNNNSCNSSSDSNTGVNGSKRYSDKDMDGSLRVSSASTATTAASTFVAEVGEPETTTEMDATTTTLAASSRDSPEGLQLDINSKPAGTLKQPPPTSSSNNTGLEATETTLVSASCASHESESVSVSVTDFSRKPPPSAAAGTTATLCDPSTMDDSSENLIRASTYSLPEFPTQGLLSQPHPLQVESVARMPKQTQDDEEIDPEVLRIAEEINKPPPPPPSEDDDKKPAAKPRSNLVNKRSPSRSPKNSVTFAALPPGTKDMMKSPDLLADDDDKAESEQDQKPAATGEAPVPKPTPLTNKQRSHSDGAGTAPPSTGVPTPRGRGLRGGRRQPQTAQDRNNRRKQIMQRTANAAGAAAGAGSLEASVGSVSDQSNSSYSADQRRRQASRSRSPMTPNNTRRPLEPNSPMPVSPVSPPLAARKPPAAAQQQQNRPLTGDSLLGPRPPASTASAAATTAAAATAAAAAAPGDNLATRSPNIQRPTVRTRVIRPLTPPGRSGSSTRKLASTSPNTGSALTPNLAAAAANPTAAEQAANDLSSKQRARRENPNNQELPASIRPGAYKEIPGRGLVRNNTLRFSIMTSLANKKRSLRKMFSSRRNTFSSANTSSREDLMMNGSGSSAMDESNQTDGLRNRYALDGGSSLSQRNALKRTASAHSVKSIPSVLVDESESGDRSYLGNVSYRSLTDARKGGLCVARPVYQREASTLDALCIIPGDLAVAVALDTDLKGACQSNTEARLEELSGGGASALPPPPPPPPPPPSLPPTPNSKRINARKMVANVMGTPIKLLKKTPKALKISKRGLGLVGRRSKGGSRSRKDVTGGRDHKSMALDKTVSVAKMDPNSPGGRRGSAVRRHSF